MESANDNVQQNTMLPPQPGTFKDREELITYVRNFGASQGYVVTIKKSCKDKRVIIGCDRGGVYRSRSKSEEPKRKRKAPSRLINCPFEVVGRKDVDDDVWVLRIKNGEHNHEPLKDMSEHRYNLRFNEEEVRLIKEMTEAGVKPRQVLETLRQTNPTLHSTPRHVYNAKARIRQGNFSERSFKSWRPNANAPADRSAEGASNGRVQQLSNFIGGNFLESQGDVFVHVVNPATQEVVYRIPSTTYEEFKAAVTAAKNAFPSWKTTPISSRQRIICKLQELIRRDIDELALSISTEQGQTIKGARADILRSLEMVEHTCRVPALQMGEFVPNTSNGIDMYSIREPLGVCAGISHFNTPAIASLSMFPIAVLCGNTFVLKPSEQAPGASMKLAALTAEAGLPDGVLNIVHGGNDLDNLMCDDDDIKAISYVGSYRGGVDICAKAASRGKCIQVHMEPKKYAVVMPDACMETTLDALVAAGFGTAGEQCKSFSTVIFVGHSTLWEKELVKRAKAIKVNGGTDARADLGPVASREVKDRICRSVQNAVESGARLVLDGRNILVPRYEKGNFVGPTILSGITSVMECCKEDNFGPVLLCTEVCSLEEAITIVNREKFGCGASIFTTSGVAARKFQNAVEAGLVGINAPVPVPLPFSSTGLTTSSMGNLNFCGKTGIQFYTQVKMVAQKWKDLPARDILSTMNLTSEGDASNQAVPMGFFSTSDSDLSSRETSPSVPTSSDRGTPDQTRSLNMPSTGNDSSSSAASMAFPALSVSNFPNQGTDNISWGSERNSMPPISQTNQVVTLGSCSAAHAASDRCYTPGQTHQNGGSDLVSQTNDVIPSDCGRVYIPIEKPHASQSSDALLHSTEERVCLPSASHDGNETETSSQMTTFSMHPSSSRSYMPTSHGFDGIALHLDAERVHTMASRTNNDPSPNIGRLENKFQF